MSVNFKAGKYYVGDLCYVINDKHWDELGEKTNWFQNDEQFEFKGKTIFVSHTAYGDGRFNDYQGREYFVDAGLIGVIPFDIIDNNEIGDGGQIIEFEKDFYASCSDKGIFKIGNITIDTSNEDEEEDEEEDYDDEEEYDDTDDWDEDSEDEDDESDFESKISNSKPRCKLSGTDGNVFAVIGNVRDTLKRAGLKEQAENFSSKAFKQHSYQDVLALCFEYVDVR